MSNHNNIKTSQPNVTVSKRILSSTDDKLKKATARLTLLDKPETHQEFIDKAVADRIKKLKLDLN